MDSLELFVEVTDANYNRYQWGANQPPGYRLQNFSFRTKLGEGFSDATGQLARRIDFDYPDLELLNDIKVVGADGSIAYEGRISAMPRELTDSHSIGVQIAGYMAHAKDQPFREVYVDRDLGGWGGMSVKRRRDMLAGGYGNVVDGDSKADPTNNEAGIATGLTGAWVSTFKPYCESLYDAGPGLTIGKVVYSVKTEGTINLGDANWEVAIALTTNAEHLASQSSGNLRTTVPITNGTLTSTAAAGTSYRFAWIHLFYNSSPGGADGVTYTVLWQKLAVYGTHGLPTYTGEIGEPPGVVASDVIRNIAGRWCPLLDVSGVEITDYVIQHLVFKDLTDPYDAMLQVNKYHLWHLGVWEGRKLHFRPHDLRDYMWEIRTDDPGTTFTPQGLSTDDLVNGMVVVYEDLLTKRKHTYGPDDDPSLKDTSPENPWNKQGVRRWGTVELSTPTLPAQAIQIGAATLAERNRPKAPGTITVTGHIRDRAGNPQPVWRVRAGDTIAITNFPNARPRLIHETSYDSEEKRATLSIDAPAQALDAVLDRIGHALTARNLG